MKFIFAWCDLYVGVFIDSKKELLYIFPMPTLGLVFNCTKTLDKFYDVFGTRYEYKHYSTRNVLDYGWQIKLFGKWYYRSLDRGQMKLNKK